MRDIYQVSSQLYRYVWSPSQFDSPKNRQSIINLLDRMITDFHRVETASLARTPEPGFTVALKNHQEALQDARDRLAIGATDYANWRLRGLMASCTSCHSRYEVSNDFVGDTPLVEEHSFDARLAQAEFLFGSRQFDAASNALFTLATSLSQSQAASLNLLRTLKLWLVIEVRVKNRPKVARERLEILIANGMIEGEMKSFIDSWITDLKKLEQPDDLSLSPLAEARKLLKKTEANIIIDDDVHAIVFTLRATALLHSLLDNPLAPSERAQALLVLAKAYLHLPIVSFEVFRGFYLEQCIEEFPGTSEAKSAFQLYEKQLRSEDQTPPLPSELARLEELRRLAYGSQTSSKDKTSSAVRANS